MANKHIKKMPKITNHEGNANQKPQRGTTSHPLEWLQLKRLVITKN